MSQLIDFLLQMIPDQDIVIRGALPMLVFALLWSRVAGYLRARKEMRVAYSRKIFHFGIFTGATLIQVWGGLPAVALYGCIVSAVVLHAVWKGEGYGFFEAMARPSDRPRQKLFIVVPMVTTALGGVLGNLLFGGFAAVGYLACGWGDAIGEPVGSRWGRHRYSVPSLGGVPAQRSLEGSSAVFLVGSIACTVALLSLGFDPMTAAKTGLAGGLAGALVEAVSNHGMDNLTMQVAASATAWFLLGGTA
jgi:phytol kinase